MGKTKEDLELELLKAQIDCAQLERDQKEIDITQKRSVFSRTVTNTALVTILVAAGTTAVTWYIGNRQLEVEREKTTAQIALERQKAEDANIAAALNFSSNWIYVCEAVRRLQLGYAAGIFSTRATTVETAIKNLRKHVKVSECPGLDPT